tara:strand:+ start:371 stop:640 length:270 start_codon:yes stop_codon:yes gene_type:complete
MAAKTTKIKTSSLTASRMTNTAIHNQPMLETAVRTILLWVLLETQISFPRINQEVTGSENLALEPSLVRTLPVSAKECQPTWVNLRQIY